MLRPCCEQEARDLIEDLRLIVDDRTEDLTPTSVKSVALCLRQAQRIAAVTRRDAGCASIPDLHRHPQMPCGTTVVTCQQGEELIHGQRA